MGILRKLTADLTKQKVSEREQRLALYDAYGSMAYGVILRILPEPELAQAVLLDLFTSLQVNQYEESSPHTACTLIRLARTKALEAQSNFFRSTTSSISTLTVNTTTAQSVFDLSFCQGYTPEAIAEKLQLSRTNVLKAFHTYFKHLRSS